MAWKMSPVTGRFENLDKLYVGGQVGTKWWLPIGTLFSVYLSVLSFCLPRYPSASTNTFESSIDPRHWNPCQCGIPRTCTPSWGPRKWTWVGLDKGRRDKRALNGWEKVRSKQKTIGICRWFSELVKKGFSICITNIFWGTFDLMRRPLR